MSARILIIDDDEGYASALARHFVKSGHEVTTVSTASAARAQLSTLAPDVIILDQRLPDASDLELLEGLKPLSRDAVFVIVTAYPDVEFAVAAMRRGVFDYFEKGTDMRECSMRIERAVDHAQLKRRVAEASAEQTERGESLLIGESPAMERLRARLRALAASDDTTALILGETGVGKGLVARTVHLLSRRVAEPFVAVDCTTIPVTLVESELFGHERGAFSGATAVKPGRVESAGRGTLFLDEIGELELPVQSKLLRLLEEREYTRVGGTVSKRLAARIITATNRDLVRAVEEGRFRADLRFRLEVFVLEVPPLRDRADDVFLLADHYMQESARALGRIAPTLNGEVKNAMRVYPFPGNVRELRNMIEQALLLSTGDKLTLEEFPVLAKVQTGWSPPTATHRLLSARPPAPSLPVPTTAVPRSPPPPARHSLFGSPLSAPPSLSPGTRSLTPVTPVPALGSAPPELFGPSLGAIRERYAEQERARLLEALELWGGNVSRAARHVGMSRYQMLRRLAKYGLR